jgi:glucosyl-dolichyl phosphate glucuronosyltransferase
MDLSIIIPTKNRASLLSNELKSIQNQTFSQNNYEVIVIDNGSIDETKNIINDFKYKIKNLRYHYEASPGLHVGRHLGCMNARSENLVFIDDDVKVSPCWIENILLSFKENEVKIVGGKNLPLYEKSPPDWIKVFWQTNAYGSYCGYLSLLDFGDKTIEIDPNFVWGLNFAIKKQTLYELGGFHPDAMPWELRKFRGDGETGLSIEAKKKGIKAIYNPNMLIYHLIPKERLTVNYFERRAFLQGISDSYSKIRKFDGLTGVINYRENGFYIKSDRFVAQCMKIITEKIKSKMPNKKSNSHVRSKIQKAYQEGFDYHQKLVRNEPNLLGWVLKKDYWDSSVYLH